MSATDANNYFVVTTSGGSILILDPPSGPMSRNEALNLAAWLVALADPDGGDFVDMLTDVQST